jgi:hypothetical protein
MKGEIDNMLIDLISLSRKYLKSMCEAKIKLKRFLLSGSHGKHQKFSHGRLSGLV